MSSFRVFFLYIIGKIITAHPHLWDLGGNNKKKNSRKTKEHQRLNWSDVKRENEVKKVKILYFSFPKTCLQCNLTLKLLSLSSTPTKVFSLLYPMC